MRHQVRAGEIFQEKISPHLSHNDSAFRKMLSKDSISLEIGTVKYPVDIERFDEFFTALSCGIIFKTCNDQLPENYLIHHRYDNFTDEYEGQELPRKIFKEFEQLIFGNPIDVLNFGKPNTANERIN